VWQAQLELRLAVCDPLRFRASLPRYPRASWRWRENAPFGLASFAVVDGVLTVNSSIGKKQAPLTAK
jgi:hypothetical protein